MPLYIFRHKPSNDCYILQAPTPKKALQRCGDDCEHHATIRVDLTKTPKNLADYDLYYTNTWLDLK